MPHAEYSLARLWRRGQSGQSQPEGALEDALAAALEDGRAWPRVVSHFGWCLPTGRFTVTRQDQVEGGRTDLRLRFEDGQQVVLELKAWEAPDPAQLARYAEPGVHVLGIARYPATRAGPRVVGCITWSALVSLPWPEAPPLPWRQLCALARAMGAAMPPVDLPALTGLVASYDAHGRCDQWARAAAELLYTQLQWPGSPWTFKTRGGRRWTERKWRRQVGWCWVQPWRWERGVGAFAGLSFGRSDVPLIVPGLPDLILTFNITPESDLGRRLATDPAVEKAVTRWRAAAPEAIREFDGRRWEQLRVRAPGTRLLEANDAEQALLSWVETELQAWREAGLLDALRPIIASVCETGDVEQDEDPTVRAGDGEEEEAKSADPYG